MLKLEQRFNLAKHREEERFLEEHHAKGLLVRSKKRDIYIFEEDTPQEVEYLIEMLAPGTDLLAWEAHRQYMGFTHLFRSGEQHYLFREKREERFIKADDSVRENFLQSRMIRRMLRAFFFAILGFVAYSSPMPPEALWLKVGLALMSVTALLFFGLRALGDFTMLQEMVSSEERK